MRAVPAALDANPHVFTPKSGIPGPGNFRAVPGIMPKDDSPRRCVYVLRSLKEPDRQYIGRTADMASRLASHNAGESPHTARQAPWQVVVLVQFLDESRASAFEKFLKSASGRAFVQEHFG
jgi:predicted GIY-YIG superfamily endonuclease